MANGKWQKVTRVTEKRGGAMRVQGISRYLFSAGPFECGFWGAMGGPRFGYVRLCSLMFGFLRKNLSQRHRDTEVQFNGRLNSTRQKIMDELWTHSLPLARPSRAFTFGRMELPLLRSVSQDWMVAVATCKPFAASQAAQVTMFTMSTLSGIVHLRRRAGPEVRGRLSPAARKQDRMNRICRIKILWPKALASSPSCHPVATTTLPLKRPEPRNFTVNDAGENSSVLAAIRSAARDIHGHVLIIKPICDVQRRFAANECSPGKLRMRAVHGIRHRRVVVFEAQHGRECFCNLAEFGRGGIGLRNGLRARKDKSCVAQKFRREHRTRIEAKVRACGVADHKSVNRFTSGDQKKLAAGGKIGVERVLDQGQQRTGIDREVRRGV